ncbi:MAG: homoserine kinase [Candidatus Desulforudis sp.]|nr:homoserine kinase [Desulforudis sp.]
MIDNRVLVRVPASSANLGPGFDCLSLALGLHNLVALEILPDGVEVRVAGEGASEIPTGDDNLVLRAARRVFNRIRVHPTGLRLSLANAIPPARGLGSSAAAVVGGLVAANALTGNQLSRDELLNLAAELEGHPDNVAPALLGGLTVAVQDGPDVVWLRLDPPRGIIVLVAVPAFPLSTPRAREILPDQVALQDAVFSLGRAALLVGAMSTGRLDLLRTAMHDRLHQPFREQLVPGLRDVFAAALDAGALGVALSGSGPAVVALCSRSEQVTPIAGRIRQAFQKHRLAVKMLSLAPDLHGARVVDRDGGKVC